MSEENKSKLKFVSMTESGALASDIKTTTELYMETEPEKPKEEKQDGTDKTV